MNSPPRPVNERGAALIMALLIMVLLSLLGAALLTMSEVENIISNNDELSEGAFYAAEAAAEVAFDKISANVGRSTSAIPVTSIGGNFSYRSGGRGATDPQPIPLVGAVDAPGYSVSTKTGYNATGYVFDVYRINATGSAPRNSQREVELLVEFGPTSH